MHPTRTPAFVLGLFLAFAHALPLEAATSTAVPYDQQCWESFGLTQSPEAGFLAGLVSQCADDLAAQDRAHKDSEDARAQQEAILKRAKLQGARLLHILRKTNPSPSLPIIKNLPSSAQKTASVLRARAVLKRQRQWFDFSADQRAQVLANNPKAVRECAQDLSQLFADCIKQYIHPPVTAIDQQPPEYAGQEHVTLAIGGKTVTTDGVTITFIRVAGDSRCPDAVDCLWAGEASIDAKVFSPVVANEVNRIEVAAPVTLTIPNVGAVFSAPPTGANSVQVGKCSVVFTSLDPFPMTGKHVEDASYRATFYVVNPAGGPCAK